IFKEKLDQAERRLERYKRNLITNQYENQTLSSNALQRINEAVVAIELTTKEKKDYLSYISSQLRGKFTIDRYPETLAIQKLLGEIDDKIDQMATFMNRYSWRSAEVVRINRNINELREKIEIEIEKLFRVMHPDMDNQQLSLNLNKAITQVDLDILKHKKESLTNVIKTFKNQASQNPSRELTLSKLEEEVAINRRIYNMFIEQTQGTQIEEAMQRADASSRFKILEPPRKPFEPINAGFRMLAMVTLVVASVMGAGAVYWREYLDKSIRTVQEAEEFFEIPVISVLPDLDKEQSEIRPKIRLLYVIAAGILLIFTLFLFVYMK
ncbi:MAG: GumC family protein, partial [bacterium]